MTDEFQSEESMAVANEPVSNEENAANADGAVVEGSSEVSASESDSTSPQARVPAATASSYRDIIAERLARKVSGTQNESARSPMAHSSDVERAVIPQAPAPEETSNLIKPREHRSNDSLPPEIEEATRHQEIPSISGPFSPTGDLSGSQNNSTSQDSSERPGETITSSRERARLRQQERASLRRGGASKQSRSEQDTSSEESESSGEQPQIRIEPQKEASAEFRSEPKDAIAERMARRAGDRGEGRQRNPEQPRRGETHRGEPRDEEARRSEPRKEEARPEESRRDRGRDQRQASAEQDSARAIRPERKRPSGDEIRKREPSERYSSTVADTGARHTPRRVIAEPRSTERSIPRTEAQKIEEAGHDAARSLALKLGISVIIPLLNEQDSLRELTAAIKQQCARLAGPKYEVIYVNDGSTDHSGEILQDILATSSRVTVLTFRRNLGKSAALAAGFTEAQYGIVITMDADLQDDPREFTNLIGKLAQGYDLVSGWKKKRYDPMSKTGPSKFFNSVTSFFSGIRLHDFNCGLKAYRKEVTESLQVYGELHRFLPALAHWQGFRVAEIPVTHHPRKFGKSKFGSSRFFKGFLDLVSIVFTNRYGKRPLHLFGTVGTLMAVAGFVIDIWLTVQWALGLTSLSNRPLLLLGLLLILVGVQLISLGLLGEMIVKNGAANSRVSYSKEKGKPSAEARERRASRVAKMSRISSGRSQSGERRGPPRR